MRIMSRPEFEAYEQRVEDSLERIGKAIAEADRHDFEEVAGAAREVIELRRAYVEAIELHDAVEHQHAEQEEFRERPEDSRSQPVPHSGEKYYEKTAEAAHEALNEIRIAREALGKIAAGKHSILPAGAYQGDLDRGFEMAANLAFEWDNKHVLEAAQVDAELAQRIALYEKSWKEHDIAYGAGSAGEPIPEIAKRDAQLLGYYREGLNDHQSDLAIADHESGLAIGGWGPVSEYWTAEVSEAKWQRLNQLRKELVETYTKLGQEGERPEAVRPTTEAEYDTENQRHFDIAASHTDRSGDQTSETADLARLREEAVGRHGEKAVAAGEELIERLLVAGREVRDSEARLDRYREGDNNREARFGKLVEATANYNQLLRQAAREAVDGNGYIREAKWHRDLETAVAMEDLRHEQRAQFYLQNEQVGTRQSDAERTSQSDDAARSDAVHQPVSRLRQIEQDIQTRHRVDRDDRDR